MHRNVAKLTAAAAELGLSVETKEFPEGTRTAEDAARAIGCEVAQIVKSLVFADDEGPLLALVSGANRVDTAALAARLGRGPVRRASGQEARDATGFAIGGVPPFGHARPLRVVVDRDLTTHERLWAAAGLPDAVFGIAPADLLRATRGEVVDLAE